MALSETSIGELLRERVALAAERDRLLSFVEWVAGYESEQQLVGSGVIEKAKKALTDG